MDPLLELICSQPGMAQRLQAEHADDGSGRCRVCSEGAQSVHYRWPCAIYRCVMQACEKGAGGPPTPAGPPPARADGPGGSR